MHGLGTIINVAAIVIGGLLGLLFGRFIRDRHRDGLCKACGLAVIFIGTAGALKGMFSVVDGKIVYGEGTAEDCGPAIKNDRIDVFYHTFAECSIFARRDCYVYFLTD